MNVPRAPVGVRDNKACISKRWGGGRRRHSWASPCRGKIHKSADVRRPDTPQAVRDISWLWAVVGCDVCHGHDGWLSDLSHYIISVRNPLFLKCLFVSPPPSCRWHLPTHSHCVKPTGNATILQGPWLMVQLLAFSEDLKLCLWAVWPLLTQRNGSYCGRWAICHWYISWRSERIESVDKIKAIVFSYPLQNEIILQKEKTYPLCE